MKLSREAIEQALPAAFEIANARGAELLAALGRFGAWRGDLAAMRGDAGGEAPQPAEASESAQAQIENVSTVAWALSYLQPRCRETLHLHYVDSWDVKRIAESLDVLDNYARKLVENCLCRLMNIIETVKDAPGQTRRRILNDETSQRATDSNPISGEVAPEVIDDSRRH